jgi:transcriptional regulator with XRE-family HTH domain
MPRRTVGDWLRDLRDARGLSQQDVQAQSKEEISRVYLSLLECNEKKNPTVKVMLTLAKAYEVEPTLIFSAYQADMLDEPFPPIPNRRQTAGAAAKATPAPPGRGIARTRG